jgi:RNA polymerase sigma factor (sigma-70 family)
MVVQAQSAPVQHSAECDNATLLAGASQGDQLAWRRLIDRYDRLVRSVPRALRLQPADVHDVAQTTWLRVVQHLHAIRDPERLPGWLAVTATHESLAVLRQASRYRPTSRTDEAPDVTVDLEGFITDQDAARDLWAAVAELPVRQRRLITTLFRDGVATYDDVATTCAMPVGSIGPTRARALSQLRRKLGQRGWGPADP